MNVQERILNSQLLMAMEKYPDLSRDLGLMDVTVRLEEVAEKEEENIMTRDSPQEKNL